MLRSPQPRFPQQAATGGYPQQYQQRPLSQPQQQQSLPTQAAPQLAQQPEEHQDVVHDTQFDYYGKMLATASSDRTIGIHVVENDGQARRVATLTGHEGPVWMVSWAHPRFGVALASASYDHKAIIWKETPQGSRQWRPVHIIDCHHGSVNAVHWAPESPMVATASSDGTVAVTVCQGGVWRESIKLSNNSNNIAHAMGATSVSFAPVWSLESDAALLVSGGCDSQVRLWCLHEEAAAQPFELLELLEGHTDWVRDVAFAPSCAATRHAVVASCGQDKSVIIHRKPWDEVRAVIKEREQASNTSSQQQTKEVGGGWERSVVLFDEPVWRLSWSPTGEMLVVTTGDSEVFILRENGEFTQPWLKMPLSEYQREQLK